MPRKEHDLSKLAGRIAFAREKRELTQQAVADAVGINQPTFSKIERGDIKEPFGILALAQALNCNPYWLERGSEAGGQWDAVPVLQRGAITALTRQVSASVAVETLSALLLNMAEEDRMQVAKRFNDVAAAPDSAIARGALLRSIEDGGTTLGGPPGRAAELPLPSTGS